MKAVLLAISSFCVTALCSAQKHYTEAQVIGYAKAIDVNTLDSSLASRKLDDWLRDGPPHAQVKWTLADTCDNKPYLNEEYPLCAKIWFSKNGEAGSILIEVGTNHKGIVGKPKLHDEVLSWEENTWIMTDGAQKLSGLPAILDQPAYAHGVGQLYNEVVEHHPIGVPTDAEMATIRPFLSRRLAEQIQTAKVCEADYLRHNPESGDAKKPSWMTSDLFSGGGNRVAPASAWPVRQGQQKDGSFLVMVNLFGQTVDLGNGLRGGAASTNGTWHIQAKVISEEEHLVIDDVRLFDGPLLEGPSHLLSESFAGCDGPHWRT